MINKLHLIAAIAICGLTRARFRRSFVTALLSGEPKVKQLLFSAMLASALAAGPAAAAAINVVGVENEYANVVSQIGGKFRQGRGD